MKIFYCMLTLLFVVKYISWLFYFCGLHKPQKYFTTKIFRSTVHFVPTTCTNKYSLRRKFYCDLGLQMWVFALYWVQVLTVCIWESHFCVTCFCLHGIMQTKTYVFVCIITCLNKKMLMFEWFLKQKQYIKQRNPVSVVAL